MHTKSECIVLAAVVFNLFENLENPYLFNIRKQKTVAFRN